MGRNKQDELITVEAWRVERMVEELDKQAWFILSRVPEPWKNELYLYKVDMTHVAVARYFSELQRRITEMLREATPENRFGEKRVMCPLCGEPRSDGEGWKLPIGLETHFDKSCDVFEVARNYAHRAVSHELKRSPLSPFSDRY